MSSRWASEGPLGMVFICPVQNPEATGDLLQEGRRHGPCALGAAGWEARGQKQDGVLQEMGLQSRVGREGWQPPED